MSKFVQVKLMKNKEYLLDDERVSLKKGDVVWMKEEDAEGDMDLKSPEEVEEDIDDDEEFDCIRSIANEAQLQGNTFGIPLEAIEVNPERDRRILQKMKSMKNITKDEVQKKFTGLKIHQLDIDRLAPKAYGSRGPGRPSKA